MSAADLNSYPPIVRDDLPPIADALRAARQRLSGKTVLITGASGFLPAYIVDTLAYLNDAGLLDQPCRQILLERSADAITARLGHLRDRSDITVMVQDVCDPITLDRQPHMIVHAASPASPKFFRKDPVGCIDANTLGTRNLLELARADACESFLYFSSSEIYGTPDPDAIPTPETYVGRVDCTGKRACYAEAKRLGESYCVAYHEQYSVPAKMVRPFHVHGPGLRIDDGRIIAALISMGLAGKPLELMSAGTATRTYGYVSDAIVGFLLVLLSDHDGQAFNVGVDKPETTVLELATIIARLFGQTEPVKVSQAPGAETIKGAPDRACPDLTKIRTLLGYNPLVALEDGLARTIAWHRR